MHSTLPLTPTVALFFMKASWSVATLSFDNLITAKVSHQERVICLTVRIEHVFYVTRGIR